MMFISIAVFAVLVFAFVLIGMIAHSFAFGSMVWLIARRVNEAAELHRPKPCAFCGSTLLPDAVMCGACGAPRDPKHVAVSSSADRSAGEKFH